MPMSPMATASLQAAPIGVSAAAVAIITVVLLIVIPSNVNPIILVPVLIPVTIAILSTVCIPVPSLIAAVEVLYSNPCQILVWSVDRNLVSVADLFGDNLAVSSAINTSTREDWLIVVESFAIVLVSAALAHSSTSRTGPN
ncbi:hypothetical protein K469DRAFT_716706 [Zopfia rhizophila CBS 207.26]|uniref:Uncharacterized protein n=1 Tax=Zopfia rhizophila CBS 207.26 TaxID=1314779 RepID=A0A6A6EQ52_9PEZI|nr:hypothetical protein K469DRAFT_716706 [Zopfia rhizophila CBS 207.26]